MLHVWIKILVHRSGVTRYSLWTGYMIDNNVCMMTMVYGWAHKTDKPMNCLLYVLRAIFCGKQGHVAYSSFKFCVGQIWDEWVFVLKSWRWHFYDLIADSSKKKKKDTSQSSIILLRILTYSLDFRLRTANPTAATIATSSSRTTTMTDTTIPTMAPVLSPDELLEPPWVTKYVEVSADALWNMAELFPLENSSILAIST